MQNLHVPTLRAEATFSTYELAFSRYELAFPHASSYRENVASARRVACSLISGWISEKQQNKEIAVYDSKDDALTPKG